jgi:hypothetical protein
MKLPARIISQNGENPHIIWEDQPIGPGDEIIDVEAFLNGYTDSVRICEDAEDADYCNSSGGYRRLVCGPERIGYFMVQGIIHHDRVVMYLDDHTIEVLHPDTIKEILESGGECEIQVHNLPMNRQDFTEDPYPFLVDKKVLIHKKKNRNK